MICAQVEGHFADLLRQSEPRDLTEVRRWENENMAQNLRAWIASGDIRGSAEFAFPFACECGRLGCETRVELALAKFERAAEPILAPGHKLIDA
jgi:aspartyl/asparaginyl beta-hydroxylase (cupin superfamily)